MPETFNRPPDMIAPPRLRKGDTIGIVAPAGPILNDDIFSAGVRLLRSMGFEVKFSRDINRRDGYLAGSDRERADEFMSLWTDPDTKAILAARGGYGTLRMLPLLQMEKFRQQPKILIGFSDISVLLNAIRLNADLITFHGPMATTLPRSDRETVQRFFTALTEFEPKDVRPSNLQILTRGKARGKLIGGNLASLTHLLGTPYDFSWQESILFLEDVGEAPYRVDRMLTHLKEAGKLSGLSGLILGSFKDCGDVELIWQRVGTLLDWRIPLWANFPAGHGEANLILPLGATVEMDDTGGTLCFINPFVS